MKLLKYFQIMELFMLSLSSLIYDSGVSLHIDLLAFNFRTVRLINLRIILLIWIVNSRHIKGHL